jgi:hypothetical protein
MRQHVGHGCAVCTKKAEVEVGGRPEYEVPPLSANLGELEPPALALPISLSKDAGVVVSCLGIKNNGSIEIKYGEKRVIVEGEDGGTT